MSQKTLPLPERLKKGAGKLGEIWKILDQRCPAAWSLDICTCQPVKRFCQGRLLWLTLAVEAGRDLQEDPYGLVLAMTASEWDATGLTMVVEHPDMGKLLIGSSGESVTGMVDMAKMMDAPEVLASTLRVLRAFPRSKVEGIQEAEAAVPEAVAMVAEAEPETELPANPDEAFE